MTDAEIARAIGCGPSEKPEWWDRGPQTLAGYIMPPIYTGPSFKEWGPQTGMMWNWLVQKYGLLNINVLRHFDKQIISFGYPFEDVGGASLPLALCEAVNETMKGNVR